jgi:hypothetical protein
MKRASKWVDLGRRVAELKDCESIVLECEGNLAEGAQDTAMA